MAVRKASRPGLETKSRIIDAALATVRADGLIGASARSIARTGEFNQALIFYHFGSVEDLLLAAVERAHDRRMDRFGPRLAKVTDLSSLVAIGKDMRGSDGDLDTQALPAIVAGWPTGSEVGAQIRSTLEPWDGLIADALERVFAGSGFGPMIPYRQMAHAVSALFLGLEMFDRLDPARSETDQTFSALQALAVVASPMIEGQPPRSQRT